MDQFMRTLEEIGSRTEDMKWSGAVVLALLGFGFMRVWRHSVKSSFAFGAGIFGAIVVLSRIKYLLTGSA